MKLNQQAMQQPTCRNTNQKSHRALLFSKRQAAYHMLPVQNGIANHHRVLLLHLVRSVGTARPLGVNYRSQTKQRGSPLTHPSITKPQENCFVLVSSTLPLTQIKHEMHAHHKSNTDCPAPAGRELG